MVDVHKQPYFVAHCKVKMAKLNHLNSLRGHVTRIQTYDNKKEVSVSLRSPELINQLPLELQIFLPIKSKYRTFFDPKSPNHLRKDNKKKKKNLISK
jgi:hypothetical protein